MIANVVSSAILCFKLMKSDKVVRLDIKELKFDKNIFVKIMQIGLPAGVQSAVFAIANIVIQSAINSLGTVVIAASSAAFNIEILAYYVLNSFSQACTTFVGQNYGAGDVKRCKKTLILCLIEDAIASASAIVLILICGKSLLSIFSSDPQVIEIGYTRLLLVFSAYTFTMLYENISGYLRGFGISLVPGNPYHHRGMRGQSYLDIHSIPEKQNVFHNYDGLSNQSVRYGFADVSCTDVLSAI